MAQAVGAGRDVPAAAGRGRTAPGAGVPRPGSQPHRVALAATALVSAGAISLDAAWWVVADFQAACALRTGGPDRPC